MPLAAAADDSAGPTVEWFASEGTSAKYTKDKAAKKGKKGKKVSASIKLDFGTPAKADPAGELDP